MCFFLVQFDRPLKDRRRWKFLSGTSLCVVGEVNGETALDEIFRSQRGSKKSVADQKRN